MATWNWRVRPEKAVYLHCICQLHRNRMKILFAKIFEFLFKFHVSFMFTGYDKYNEENKHNRNTREAFI